MKESKILKGIGNGVAQGIFFVGKTGFQVGAFVLSNVWKGMKAGSKAARHRRVLKELEEDK